MTTAPLHRPRATFPQLHRRPLALCLAAILATPALPALARPSGTLTVTSCADAGAGSLRDALAGAVSGDVVEFSTDLGCSTISLSSGALAIAAAADVLAIHGPGRTALTIDGGYTDRVLVHASGAAGTLTISGLAMQHGYSSGDGGCLSADGSVILDDVEISECRAGAPPPGLSPLGANRARGGGLSVAGDATLTSSFVGDNKVDGAAGAAYGAGLFVGGTATLIDATVSGNFGSSDTGATYGGGVAVGDRDGHAQGTLIVTSSALQNNTAFSHCGYCPVRGGGAFVYGSTTFDASTISGNTAFSDAHYGAGGGLYFKSRYGGAAVSATLTDTDLGSNTSDENGGAVGAGGDLTITGGTLSGNSALSGGAIAQFSGSLKLVDSLLTGNIATNLGGGIFLFGYGEVEVDNSTISENLATNGGGAIANTYGSVHATSSTFTANSAGAGGAIWFQYPYYTLALESTIVAGNTVGDDANDIFAPGGSVTGSHDFIGNAPDMELPSDTLAGDPLLLPLADNGGAAMTHALDAGSLAIDAGSNTLDVDFDQRGAGFVRVYGDAADIGAFEAQPTAPPDRIFADGFEAQ